MKILITGGAGFIGTNLIPKLLEAGHEIMVIDNLSHGTFVNEIHGLVDFQVFDCLNRERLFVEIAKFKPDATFMLHGLVSIYDCHNEPQKAINTNLISSTNVFDALIAAGCPRLIFAETSAVYENCKMSSMYGYNETQSDPQTIYAVTKAALLLLAKSYSKLRGLEFTALRYFNVAGAMQDYSRTIPPLFAGAALRIMGGNNPIVFGDGNRRRDFIHVDDINEFHLLCLEDSRTINEVFNLGTGFSTSIFEICSDVYHLLNPNSPDTVKFNMMPEINGEAFEIKADITKAKAIGWEPKKTLEDALKDTINYLEQQVLERKVDPKTFMTDLNIDKVKIG
jgi:UDP-glucose 4-epimerase